MLPPGTTGNHAYYQSRNGAKFDTTVFTGLQYILKEYLAGQVVTQDKIDWQTKLAHNHLGPETNINPMWSHILARYGGRLPLHIKAIPEGTPVPVNNVLMTVENLDDFTAPLSTAIESLLTHVWYPSTVATLSRETFKVIKSYLLKTSDNLAGLKFMLHDFGYRSATCDEAASIGGFGHLVNGLGTDTVTAIEIAHDFYNTPLNEIAFSVPATEHSIMSAKGPAGEAEILEAFLRRYNKGIASGVADTFDYYRFVEHFVCNLFKDLILAREPDINGNCAFVTRPDSTTPKHPRPASLVVWTLETLWNTFKGHVNTKNYKVLDKHVRILWGDGITKEGIEEILTAAMVAGFSAENLVFGMGGGLLQKINRDTNRFAFKSAAQKRNGIWHNVFKYTLDASKRSFTKGRMKLIRVLTETGTEWQTVPIDEYANNEDQLVSVFNAGEITREWTLSDLRKNSAL